MAKPKIAILGAGASAAYASRALEDLDLRPTIFAEKSGVYQKGAFYFHWLPPDVAELVEQERVATVGIGLRETYIERQWGKYDPKWESSFPKEDTYQSTPCYNPSIAYDKLLGVNVEINPTVRLSKGDIVDIANTFDLVIQTFPESQTFKANGKYIYRIPVAPYYAEDEEIDYIRETYLPPIVRHTPNFIVYNGREDKDWCRMCYMWGNLTFEYPYYHTEFAGQEDIQMLWDLHPDCPPQEEATYADNIILMGRLAMMEPKFLSHEAYEYTLAIVEELYG